MRYKAFISYRRGDATSAARWIRNRLLAFRPSPELARRLARDGGEDFANRNSYYLDTSYQVASEDFWTQNIVPALQSSERLIVISSPSALRQQASGSENWVAREIDTFLTTHGVDEGARRIIVVLVRGAPTDRFPGRLGELGQRWDWVDLRELTPLAWLKPGASERLGDAFLKIAAALFHVPQDLVPILRQEEARRRGRLRLLAVAAASAIIVALSAALGWAVIERQQALRSEARAVQNYEAARDSVDRLVVLIGGGLRDTQGISVMTVDRALSQVDRLVSDLARMNTADPLLERSRASMLHEFARTYRQAGDDAKARQAEETSLTARRRLRDLFPDRPELSADLASSLELLGDIERSARRLSEARSHFEGSRNERQRLLDKWPDHKDRDEWLLGLSQSEVRLGDVDLDESRLDGIRSTPRAQALVKDGDEHYRRSLAGGASLYRQNPESERWQRELSWGFYKRGDYNAAVSRHEDAITDYDNALCLRRRLVAKAEYNTRYVSDVAWTLQKIGSSWMALERWSVAETALLESLALRQRLARHGAQDDKTLNRDYYFSIQRLGELKMRTNAPEVALALVLEGKRVQLELQGSDGKIAPALEVPSMTPIETWARTQLVPAEAKRIEKDPGSVLNRRVLAEAGTLLTPRGSDEACISELRKTIVTLMASGGH